MQLLSVALDEIDWKDRTFEIKRFHDEGRLRESLFRAGILNPPRIWMPGGRMVVVDGFKRLAWAGEIGWREAVCLFLPEKLTLSEVWERRIGEKLFESAPDLAEKIQMVGILGEIYAGKEIPGHFLAALNISPRPEILAGWSRLFAAGPQILKEMGSGDISERAALELSGWDAESMMAGVNLLNALRCSASIQVEIIERVHEISIREGRKRTEILNESDILDILGDRKQNHRRKTQAVRDLLTRQRYPRLSQRESRFRQDAKSLGLPPEVRIVPPPAYEGDGWKLEISFTCPEELRDALKTTGDLAESDRLSRLMGGSPNERS